jgi:glutaconate CoA-transferase subunit A
VANSVIRQDMWKTSVAYADVVVEAPYGSHPYASHGFYVEDEEAILDYVKASTAYRKGDERMWRDYLDRAVTGPPNHREYLRGQDAAYLAQLANAVHA